VIDLQQLSPYTPWGLIALGDCPVKEKSGACSCSSFVLGP
jgi:hypothetical protein